MQYSQETREQVLNLLKEGASVNDVHEFTEVPVSTIYRWRDENSRENQTDSQDSCEKLEGVVEFLKKFLLPQISKDIKETDKQLSESAGTFQEKMYHNKLEKLQASLKELEAL